MQTLTSAYLSICGADGSFTDFYIIVGTVALLFIAFSWAFRIRSI